MNILSRWYARVVYWATWQWHTPTPAAAAVPHIGATEDGLQIPHQVDVDEFTTDIELHLAMCADLAAIERRFNQRVDAWWPTVLERFGVTELDLQAHDGWAGVHDLVEVG